MLTELDHPFSRGEPVYDVTFENVQAGLRTDYLFRIANQRGGIVLGTGDLSELALGWSTYGVGDQMSHYNVNGGVPKTLIQHLIRWVVSSKQFDDEVGEVLTDVLGTEITPELVPTGEDEQVQSSEAKVGPYSLQDFTLFHVLRYGFRPSKIAFLAWHAWRDAGCGDWPPGFPADKPARLLAVRDPALARGLRAAVLRVQPVQALRPAQRPQGLRGRVAVAAWRLAGAVGHVGPDLAGRRAHDPGRVSGGQAALPSSTARSRGTNPSGSSAKPMWPPGNIVGSTPSAAASARDVRSQSWPADSSPMPTTTRVGAGAQGGDVGPPAGGRAQLVGELEALVGDRLRVAARRRTSSRTRRRAGRCSAWPRNFRQAPTPVAREVGGDHVLGLPRGAARGRRAARPAAARGRSTVCTSSGWACARASALTAPPLEPRTAAGPASRWVSSRARSSARSSGVESWSGSSSRAAVDAARVGGEHGVVGGEQVGQRREVSRRPSARRRAPRAGPEPRTS